MKFKNKMIRGGNHQEKESLDLVVMGLMESFDDKKNYP